jgi:hypothetical protein
MCDNAPTQSGFFSKFLIALHHCIAQSIDQTESMANNLKMAGFSSNGRSVLLLDKSITTDFANERHSKAPEVVAILGFLD